MPISVSCDTCGRAYRLKDAAAGKTIRCKDCESPIKIPKAGHGEIEEYGDDEWGDSSFGSAGAVDLPPSTVHRSAPTPRKKKKKRSGSGSSSNAGPLAAKIGGGVVGLLVLVGVAAKVMRAVDRAGGLNFGGGGFTWQEYSPAGQPVSMLMPGNPVEGTQFEGGIPMKTATVEIRSPKSAFGFTCVDVPAPPGAQLDIEGGLAGAKQGMLQRLPPGTQVTGERAITISDEGGNVHRGSEIAVQTHVQGDHVEFVYRYYFVGRKMVIIFTAFAVDDADDYRSDSAKFLDSLKVKGTIPVAG